MRWLILLIYAKEIADCARAIEVIAKECLREKRLPNKADEKVLTQTAALLLKIGLTRVDVEDKDIDSLIKAFKD